MSDQSKQEQYELELKIYQAAGEPGVQYMREWLSAALETFNETWPKLEGDYLTRAQGSATSMQQLLRIIVDGPKIRKFDRVTVDPKGGITK